MDVNELVSREKFYFSDCIFLKNKGVVSFYFEGDKIFVNNDINIDEEDLTDIFANFTVEHNGSVYVAGEASAHGSCGFFYKKTNESIDWMLMSLESEPFIDISYHNNMISFLSNNASTWTILDDELLNIKIEK